MNGCYLLLKRVYSLPLIWDMASALRVNCRLTINYRLLNTEEWIRKRKNLLLFSKRKIARLHKISLLAFRNIFIWITVQIIRISFRRIAALELYLHIYISSAAQRKKKVKDKRSVVIRNAVRLTYTPDQNEYHRKILN